MILVTQLAPDRVRVTVAGFTAECERVGDWWFYVAERTVPVGLAIRRAIERAQAPPD